MACGAWGLFGERVQRADEQPILVRQLLMFGAGDFIDSLNVRWRPHTPHNPPRSGTISGDRFSLGYHVKRAAFSDKHIDAHERLEPGTEA